MRAGGPSKVIGLHGSWGVKGCTARMGGMTFSCAVWCHQVMELLILIRCHVFIFPRLLTRSSRTLQLTVDRSVERGTRNVDNMKISHSLGVMVVLSCFQWNLVQAVCGKPVYSSRIVGGKDAEHGNWPWMVSIHIFNQHICGGTLISNAWVLTSANCIDIKKLTSYIVYFGRHKQEDKNPNEIYSTIKSVFAHQLFNSHNLDYNIALLRINQSIMYTDYIMPVCLPASTLQVHCTAKMWITGWGDIGPTTHPVIPETLAVVDIEMIKRSKCQAKYQKMTRDLSLRITDRMLCAGSEDGSKDACHGDSGGPLVTHYNGLWVQFGIVSFAKGCGNPELPAIYTDVAFFQSWLKKLVPPLQFITPSVITKKSPEGCQSGGPPRAMRGLPAHAGSLVSLLLCVTLLVQ
ncbi:serine protease 27-like [Scyliorhinus torazame]|uniref:serine protease 27-like n=1 Tax=Scyliorhinus torazame TaxID=75743 RepID=UPI003B5C33F7